MAEQKEDPKFRPTNAATDSKGEFLFFEGKLAFWPLGTGFAGILFFSVLVSQVRMNWLTALVICFTPAVVVGWIVWTFVNKKPPGHLSDWLDEHVFGKSNASFEALRQPKRFK